MALVVGDDAPTSLRRGRGAARRDGPHAEVDLEQLDADQQSQVREVGVRDARGLGLRRERAERAAGAEQHGAPDQQAAAIQALRHCIG